MTHKFAHEIAANLERSKASIRAAEELISGGYYDFVASRAYYAAFYAATALLLSEELGFGKHSSVISSIHQRFVKTGKLDEKCGKDLNWLFELRGVGDYGAATHVSPEDASKAIEAAANFLNAAKSLLQDLSE
jgi:uncharacterized protein (UPF0332 family)